MRSLLLSFFLISLGQSLLSQPTREFTISRIKPRETTILYKLGETVVPIKITRYGETNNLVMINLHSDETTSLIAAQRWLEIHGGLLIRIENRQKRNIKFKLRGKSFQFDPNRMFSKEGIKSTLEQQGRVTELAITETEKFGKRILDLIPENIACVIALHNNTEGNFTINNYLPGSNREIDARKVYADAGQDNDDLFLTTDSVLYTRLSADGYNIVWQDNENARKDGSLSVYCGERGIRYVNCETQHGKKGVYFEMLSAACEHILNPKAGISEYAFLLDMEGLPGNEMVRDIQFGERKVGTIKTFTIDTLTGKISGQLELDSHFPLYTNIDFFYFPNEKRLEARIDPTREKKLMDAADILITIVVKS